MTFRDDLIDVLSLYHNVVKTFLKSYLICFAIANFKNVNECVDHLILKVFLIGIKYRNCRRTLHVYLCFFAIWIGQIQ